MHSCTDFPIHSWRWSRPQKYSMDSLESRDAVSFPDFPPDFRHSPSLLHSHHDDSQLPGKHHNSLKDIRPDDGLQTTLLATDKIHENEHNTC